MCKESILKVSTRKVVFAVEIMLTLTTRTSYLDWLPNTIVCILKRHNYSFRQHVFTKLIEIMYECLSWAAFSANNDNSSHIPLHIPIQLTSRVPLHFLVCSNVLKSSLTSQNVCNMLLPTNVNTLMAHFSSIV